MQTVIAQPALTAQARLADPRLVAKNFPGKHACRPVARCHITRKHEL
jgi:hypothetical protein